jgi:hypothetical protein
MPAFTGFRLPHLCLPAAGVDLRRWAVVACDQHTAEPEYWRAVAEEVGDAPSTLNLIFPEVYLGRPDAGARIERIHAAMREYLARGLLVDHEGLVLVERRIGARVRRGLMLELDLEHYDFDAQSQSLIRPTEGTMVERLAPRIAVRRDAALELPHILVLIDDPKGTVVEPLAAERGALAPLYRTELMQGGGSVAGHAVAARAAERALEALAALAAPDVYSRRYGVPPGTPPMLFAMGDGNHSLATAKSAWQEMRGRVGLDHPARWALVEALNIHDPALVFEPIHRLLLGVSGDLREALVHELGATVSDVPDAQAMRRRVAAAVAPRQAAGLIGPGRRFAVVEMAQPPASLVVGSLQPLLDRFVAAAHAREIDYVHGDDVIERLGQVGANLGLHIPTVSKSELLQRVVHEGPLPRKTFSMGEAHEKRFYVESRRLD